MSSPTVVWTARIVAAAGLVVDVLVHVRLAGRYDLVSATVSEGTLFRLEAAAAALAALLVLVWRHWVGDLFAWVVAAAGIVAVLVYCYVDVGAFGPFPDMYEPIWSADKVWALAGQTAALVSLGWLLTATHRRSVRRRL